MSLLSIILALVVCLFVGFVVWATTRPQKDSRQTTILVALIFVGLLFNFFVWAYPKIFTGDYADVTIGKITVEPNGQGHVEMSTVSSSGTEVVDAIYSGNKYMGGGSSNGGGIFGRPRETRSGIAFMLNPEGAPDNHSPNAWAPRLLVHEGEKRHLRAGERLYYFDFKTADGVRHDGYCEVVPPR